MSKFLNVMAPEGKAGPAWMEDFLSSPKKVFRKVLKEF
jgi:hypothetical protein